MKFLTLAVACLSGVSARMSLLSRDVLTCGHELVSPYDDNCGAYSDVKDAASFLIVPASSYCGHHGVVLEESAEGGVGVSELNVGDWLGYDIKLPKSAAYRVQLRVSSEEGEGALEIENAFTKELYYKVDTMPYTGDSQAWDTISLVLTLPEGPSTMLFRVAEPGFSVLWFSIEEIGEVVDYPIETQGYVKAFGREIVDERGNPLKFKGMTLGGWMVNEPYMMLAENIATSPRAYLKLLEDLMGVASTNQFRMSWLENYFQLEDIQEMKELGYNLVRVPLHYNLFTQSIDNEPGLGHDTWLLTGMDLLDELVRWCTEENMYLILDLQAAPGGQGRDTAVNDYDPRKDSLWEDVENRRKTIALWKQIAERFVDNPWVAGYDLLNAVDWNFDGNQTNGCEDQANIPLKAFYQEAIASIRQVDPNHMIILGGNCWGTNFNGLLPIGDDNVALGFHHYFKDNSILTLKEYLELRISYNVPLMMSQGGENHNQWMNEAVDMLESNGIGWAFSPWKKMDSSSTIYSITGTTLYSTLIDVWTNGGEVRFDPFNIMMQIASNAALGRCTLNRPMTDALLGTRGDCESGAVAYAIDVERPERIEAEDFCRLRNSVAENAEDQTDSDGLNLGWMEKGAMASYKVEIPVWGMYKILYRVASIDGDGGLKIERENQVLGVIEQMPETDGWQTWGDVSHVVELRPGTQILDIVSTGPGWNLNWFEISMAAPVDETPVEETRGIGGESRI